MFTITCDSKLKWNRHIECIVCRKLQPNDMYSYCKRYICIHILVILAATITHPYSFFNFFILFLTSPARSLPLSLSLSFPFFFFFIYSTLDRPLAYERIWIRFACVIWNGRTNTTTNTVVQTGYSSFWWNGAKSTIFVQSKVKYKRRQQQRWR